jgi:shikimate dehydrogenase
MNNRFAVIGKNVSNSMSPHLFNWMYKKLEWDTAEGFSYDAISVDNEEDIEAAIEEYRGVNVTMPYKKSVTKFTVRFESIFPNVNCLIHEWDGWIGRNTDWGAFLMTLYDEYIDPRAHKFLLFGDGDVSKTIQKCLSGNIEVVNRDKEKFQRLVEEQNDPAIIINCTPLTHESPLLSSNIYEKHILYDLNYHRSVFLEEGKSNGNRTVDGVSMFVYQALASICNWQARPAMKHAAKTIGLDNIKAFVREQLNST